MNPNFDLNIENYTKNELEDLFELTSGTYSEQHIDEKENRLRQNIMLDKSITYDVKNSTIIFVQKAKDILKSGLKKNLSEIVQSFENNYKNTYNLDKTLRPVETKSEGGTFIIEKPHTSYGRSMPSEFYQGIINPLDKRVNRQNLNIDTRFRDNYYNSQSTNFHIDLPLRLTNVVSMQLSSIELPSTFYVISKQAGNNYLTLRYEDLSGQVIIPDGNYSYNTLTAFINNYISAKFSDTILSTIVFGVDNECNSGSGKTIVGVSCSSTQPFNFVLDFQADIEGNQDINTPLPLKLGWILGFREGIYINNSTYISEGLIDLLGPKYVYLVVDDFNNSVNNGFYAAFSSSILNKNILARISLQGLPFSTQTQSNLSLITFARQYYGPVDIQKLTIQLLDEYGRVINLNNCDYSFCLTLQSIYDL